MKLLKSVLVAAALLSASALSLAETHQQRAFFGHGAREGRVAHNVQGPGGWHGHWHGYTTVYVGGWPWYSPWFYGYAWPYYPYDTAVAPAAPVEYVQMNPPAADAAPAMWYYCANPAGYYPYVKACPGGWQQVQPQPPQ